MRTLHTFFFLVIAVSSLYAGDITPSAVISSFYEKPYDIATSVRTNGCKLELRRYPETYTKNKPKLQGFWVQDVFVGKNLILRIQHSAVDKEQFLAIERGSDYGVLQIDRDLDGKYETLIVSSLKGQRLKDVLLVTTAGWLRHATTEEYHAWLHRGEINKRAIETTDEAIKALSK